MLEIAPWDEHVLCAAGSFARADGGVSAVKAIHELGADAILDLAHCAHVCLFPFFKFCWKFDFGALGVAGFDGGRLRHQIIDRSNDSL